MITSEVTKKDRITGLHTLVRKPQNPISSEDLRSHLEFLSDLSERVLFESDFPEINHYSDLALDIWQGAITIPALVHSSADWVLIVNDLKLLTEHTVMQLFASHQEAERLISVFSPGMNPQKHVELSVLELIDVRATREFLSTQSLTDKTRSVINIGLDRLWEKRWQLMAPIPSRFYRSARKFRRRYQYWKSSRSVASANNAHHENGDSTPEVDLYNAMGKQFHYLIPASETNIYTGDKEDVKTYLVERLDDFYSFPKTIFMVLTNRCNLKCVMCPFHSPKYTPLRTTNFFDGRRIMPLSIIERVAKEAGRYGAGFHIGELDEPALHPELPKIVQIARDSGVRRVHITTNGLVFTPKLSEAVIRAGLDSISFSIDAATKETYKEIRGGNFKTLVRNVTEFIRLRDKYRPKLKINACMIMQGAAINEKEDFKNFWREQGVDTVSNYQLFDMDTETGHFQVDREAKFYEAERSPCSMLWDQCFIYPDGEVSLCCTTNVWIPRMEMNQLSVGNLNERSLKEIWSGEKYQNVRRAHLDKQWNEVPYCEGCDMWAASYTQTKFVDPETIMIYNENEAWFEFFR